MKINLLPALKSWGWVHLDYNVSSAPFFLNRVEFGAFEQRGSGAELDKSKRSSFVLFLSVSHPYETKLELLMKASKTPEKGICI